MTATQQNLAGWLVRSLLALILLVFAVPSILAQNTTAGAITGIVKDNTGAVLPNAVVIVTNQQTNQVATAKTSDHGFYTVENLPDGDYTVSVAQQGFQQVQIKGIHLDPGQRRGQDIQLQLGSVETKVNVEADAVAVQTESAESGGTITAKEVANLMLNGRNFQQLATLIPGVSSTKGTNAQLDSGYLGQTFIIVGGASSEETTYTIDGVYDMTPTSLINVNITPSIDVINEMRVLKNAYSAKYGYAGSGQIMIETKQGTAHYHGSGYEYIRNNSFAVAKPYSLSGQPITQSDVHFDIFGFALGGPVFHPKVFHGFMRDQLFFEAGAEWKVNHQAVLLNSRSEFTPAIRAGDLSLSHTAPVCGPPLSAAAVAAGCTSATLSDRYLNCDSVCQNLLAARNLSPANCFLKDANGVTNGLVASCFDPASAYFIDPANNFLPLPNVPANNNTNFANYINTKAERDLTDDIFARIDEHIGQKHLITARYMYEEVNDVRPARNYNDPSPNPGAIAYTPAMNALVRWNYNITNTLSNTAGLAYTFQKVQLLPTGQYHIPSGLINQAFNNGDTRLPGVNIGGYWSWLGVGAQPNFSRTGDGIFSDDVTWVKGRHILQAGGLYMWNIVRLNSNAFAQGNFTFNGGHTGDVAADFLLGFLALYSQSNVQRSGAFHQHWYDLYVQDDWKATPRLMLNMGVRYSFYSPTTKEGNDITNFQPSTFNPAVAPQVTTAGKFVYNSNNQPLTASGAVANYLTNGIVTACQNGVPCGFTDPRKGLFAPRVGFAYRINDKGTQSLHGGYGIGYTLVGMFQTSGLLSNNPYVSTPSYSNTQFSSPVGAVAGAPGLQSVSALDPTRYRPAMLQSWSLTYENEVFRNAILQIAYAGDKIDHIFSNAVDINFPLNGTSTNSATCNASPNNPGFIPQAQWQYDPCINNTGGLQVNSAYYRPYQGYTSISTGIALGSSNYHGLQTGFNYRARDLQLKTAYTFSKALGTQNQTNTGSAAYAFDSNISFQNPRNPSADYGRPNYDRTHVFTSSYVYELPFFRHAHNFFLREFVGGWGNSGLLTIESGFAQGVGISTPYAGLANRANQVAPIVRYGGSGKGFQGPIYSSQSFALPPFGTFGNSEPGVLRGPREVSFATAMNKNFPIVESVNMQLRAEAFNVFNHPNVNGFNSTISNVAAVTQSFGTASSVGDMRVMEFSARVTF